MLLTKTIAFKIRKEDVDYYKNLGYEAEKGQVIEIDIIHLKKQSHKKVEVKCDYCGKIFEKAWYHYNEKKVVNKDCCYDCCNKKCIETFQNKYGVKTPLQVDYYKEKMRKTNLEKYGVENSAQAPQTKEKAKITSLKKYGVPFHITSEEVKQKIRETCLKKYGATNIAAKDSIKRKEIEQKLFEYKANKGKMPASKDQKHLCNLYQCECNKLLCGHYFVDCFFEKDNIYCEYNGGGHDLNVKFGQITRAEFNKKEAQRYHILKRNGYKTFIIDNKGRHLPSDEVLLSIKELAFKYLKEENCNYIRFDVDNKTIKTKQKTLEYDYKNPINFGIDLIFN